MRILSRRTGERLRIGNEVIVTVLRVRGDQVRLRVTVPPEIGVYREEIVCELSHAATHALSPRFNHGAPSPSPKQ